MSEFEPTRAIETLPDGRLQGWIYAQDGALVPLAFQDTPHNRRFIVWLRKFDRAGPQTKSPTSAD